MELPEYDDFLGAISSLALPFSASQLHGMLCAYLVIGATDTATAFLTALSRSEQDQKTSRAATVALFNVLTITQQQLIHLGLDFKLLLPDDEHPLAYRAQAFSEWCEGFIATLNASNIQAKQLTDVDSREALEHIAEFSELNYETLDINEEDEAALAEVCEYTRIAVLHLHSDLSK
jgi:uncharacterized protein YgfB (UPF0149 family)